MKSRRKGVKGRAITLEAWAIISMAWTKKKMLADQRVIAAIEAGWLSRDAPKAAIISITEEYLAAQ